MHCRRYPAEADVHERSNAEQIARELGFRDVGNGLVILAAPTAGLAQRVFFDVSDAIMFGRSRPKVGIGALVFAALGVYTLAAR